MRFATVPQLSRTPEGGEIGWGVDRELRDSLGVSVSRNAGEIRQRARRDSATPDRMALSKREVAEALGSASSDPQCPTPSSSCPSGRADQPQAP